MVVIGKAWQKPSSAARCWNGQFANGTSSRAAIPIFPNLVVRAESVYRSIAAGLRLATVCNLS